MSLDIAFIKEYVELDFESILDVYHRSREPESCFVKNVLTRSQFALLIRKELIFLCVKQSKVIGFISICVPERFVHHLYILPEYQSSGIGTKLIEHCIQLFGLPISLKSLAANEKACSYYESHSWVNEEIGHGADGLFHHYWLR